MPSEYKPLENKPPKKCFRMFISLVYSGFYGMLVQRFSLSQTVYSLPINFTFTSLVPPLQVGCTLIFFYSLFVTSKYIYKWGIESRIFLLEFLEFRQVLFLVFVRKFWVGPKFKCTKFLVINVWQWFILH